MSNQLRIRTAVFLALLVFQFQLQAQVAAEAPVSNSKTSEFLHQAPGETFELTPTFLTGVFLTKYKGITSLKSSQSNVAGIGLRGEYGLTENYSLGLALAYSTNEQTYDPSSIKTTKSSGLADPTLSFKGHHELGMGSIHYGFDLSTSIEKSKSSTVNDSNMASGGQQLTPYVAYEFAAGVGKIGGKFSSDLVKSDRAQEVTTSSGTTSSTISGGKTTTVQIFGEIPLQKATVGLSLSYGSTAATKTKVADVTTDNKNEGSQSILQVYGVVPIESMSLIGTVGFTSQRYADKTYSDYIESSGGLIVGVGLRIPF